MTPLNPTAYVFFIVYKDYKNRPKTYLSNVLNQPQDPASHLSSYRSCVTIYRDIFWSPSHVVFSLYLPSTFDHTYADQWSAAFEVHPDMPYRRVSEPKIISLYLVMWSWWLLQVLLFSHSFDVVHSTFWEVLTMMFIIYYQSCDPNQVTKSLRPLFFRPQKIHHHHHSACCIVGFLHQCIYTLFNIYLGMIIFTLFVYGINL